MLVLVGKTQYHGGKPKGQWVVSLIDCCCGRGGVDWESTLLGDCEGNEAPAPRPLWHDAAAVRPSSLRGDRFEFTFQ